jgi:hypothetical protein
MQVVFVEIFHLGWILSYLKFIGNSMEVSMASIS